MKTRAKSERIKHVLVAPSLAFFIGLTLFPLIFTIVVSLSHWPLGAKLQFRGLANYIRLITDRTFLIALKNTVVIVVIAVVIEYLLGLGLALLVGREMRGGKLIRLLILLPMMMPPVAVGFMWKLLYHQTLGPLNHILGSMKLPTLPWTTQPGWALFSIILVDVWQWTSFMFIILLAGIASLPEEPFESARVDGATSWQIFRDITFPLILPASIGAVLLRSIELFKLFDTVFILTGGGPGISTTTLTLHAYATGLRVFAMGKAGAISILLLLLVIVISTLFLNFARKRIAVQEKSMG